MSIAPSDDEARAAAHAFLKLHATPSPSAEDIWKVRVRDFVDRALSGLLTPRDAAQRILGISLPSPELETLLVDIEVLWDDFEGDVGEPSERDQIMTGLLLDLRRQVSA